MSRRLGKRQRTDRNSDGRRGRLHNDEKAPPEDDVPAGLGTHTRYIVTEGDILETIRAAAAEYAAAGLAVCVIRAGDKRPTSRGWSGRSAAPGEFRSGDQLGIVYGWPSDFGRPGHSTACIDLDAEEALAAADNHLPPTLTEGRASKPRSHRLYLVPNDSIPDSDVSTAGGAVAAARDRGKHPGPRIVRFDGPGGRLIDLLGTGGQAVAPPSTHSSGERRAWTEGRLDVPTVVGWPELLAAVRALAKACGWTQRVSPPAGRMAPRGLAALAALGAAVPHVPLGERERRAADYVLRCRGGHGVPGTRQGERAEAACYRLCCTVVHGFGLGPDEALPILARWGRRPDQLDESGGHYPWDERDLLRKLEHAHRTGDRDGRPVGYLLA